MPPQRQWVFSPDTGGVKISDRVKRDVQKRLEALAAERFQGKYSRLDIRFKAQFCYIDAYQEPPGPTKSWPPKDWPETREETLSGCATRPRICAACANSALSVGAGPFTPIAMKDTNFRISLTESLLASQKTLFWRRPTSIWAAGPARMNQPGSVSVPNAVRPVYDAILARPDPFCAQHLNDEYAQLCHELAATLARKRPSPLARGKPENCACGIV